MGFIKFLGTAGARFVMIKQLRSSGGIWIRYKKTNVLIDPGPGALVRCNAARPKLDPGLLDGIILTHKHLDHSGDVNVMIEAMTEGGFKKKGVLFAPCDALGNDGVIFSYLRSFPQEIVPLKEGKFSLGDIAFEVPLKNMHSCETYGLKFFFGKSKVSFVADTKYFDALISSYKDSAILILNVVFYDRRDEFEHLCLEDAIEIINKIKPEKAILTHFGMSMLKNKPHLIEKKLQNEVNAHIQLAYDGFSLELPDK
ncbi:MAG: MBL fold metallo-hydrolase [Candidatus Omnitrophica bacterium]|nr:MBL fold metallo-hydrolase [Candidatus Omnitrophota bacterium]